MSQPGGSPRAARDARDSKTSKRKRPLDFAYAFRSFRGYLEGTEKAAHTIRSYESDLRSFAEFLEKGLGRKRVAMARLNRNDLEKYHEYLKAQGFRTNTRRRKLMTVRRLLQYLTRRNRLPLDVGKKLPTPHKVERIPPFIPRDVLFSALRQLEPANPIQARDRVLLQTLAETGCLVSEVPFIRFAHWRPASATSGPQLQISGKQPRSLAISPELYAEVMRLERPSKQATDTVFEGFNKFGSLGGPITSRGVEILVKRYATKLGLPELTPRVFRHSAVVRWWQEGASREEIRLRLGLKTNYAFRTYDPLLKPRETAEPKSKS